MKRTWQNSSCFQSLSGQCGVHRVLEEKVDSGAAGLMVTTHLDFRVEGLRTPELI